MYEGSTADWCFIDQEQFINQQYHNVTCKPGQFSLVSPHILSTSTLPPTNAQTSNSHTTTIEDNTSKVSEITSQENNTTISTNNEPTNNIDAQKIQPKKSKKRKRAKKPPNTSNILAIDEAHLSQITKDYESFLASALYTSQCAQSTSHVSAEISVGVDLIEWGETVKAMQQFQGDSVKKIKNITANREVELTTLFNTLVNYSGTTSGEIRSLDTSFVIPPLCSFLISDITKMDPLISNRPTEGYDLIVMDPPWENKSAHRSNKYQTLPNFELFKLPIQYLSSNQCIVAVWVTNKNKFISFVKNSLFPYWGFTYLTTWHWLKVTSRGELPFPLDSQHKKPYEPILIGVKRDAEVSNITSITNHKTIVSVPGAHSRKPCLKELFQPVLAPHPHCLELFARNLVENWTSWGNEVLNFQNEVYFNRENR